MGYNRHGVRKVVDNESGENYLESVLILKKRNGKVRSVDIANFFGYSKPSICRAVKVLTEKGYLHTTKKLELELTDPGLALAEKIYEKHNLLKRFFEMLGVEEETAEKDACRIEHVISEESFTKIKDFITKR